MPSRIQRREFLIRSKSSLLGLGAGLTILVNPKSVRAAPANEKVILAIVGCRGRGPMLVNGFLDRGDCEFAYLADVHTQRFTHADAIAERQGGRKPKCVQDFRAVLDDKSLDAAVLALPPHWHALATIWCCQAEKDVYVEKPPSHNCWEGRKMVEAARKHQRVVQVGTQNRSAPYNFAAKKFIEEGKLGDIHLCRVYQQRALNSSFQMGPDADPPDGLDWDMWNGPAPARKFNPTLFSRKNEFWDYGGGDIVGDGIHQLDLARWLCGVDYPKSVYSTGGRFAGAGASEIPDTQTVVYEFDKMLMTMGSTGFTPYMLKTPGEIRENDLFPYWPQNSTRIEIFGTEAMMLMGRHGGGWQVFTRPKDRKPVVKDQRYGRHPDPEHKENFVECIRTRKLPNADVEQGHQSALLSHLGSISYRVGRKLTFDRATEQIVDDPEAMKLYKRRGREPWIIPEEV
ncbi:MAG: Gfo/Idh/MocA family oxidoreductase [Planctomycetota bacterium]